MNDRRSARGLDGAGGRPPRRRDGRVLNGAAPAADRADGRAPDGAGGRAPLVVIGDALLDRDVEGTAERLCPDAPVPVLDERETRSRPGGAGLAAVLAAADGGREVTLVTALADDAAGDDLRALLAAARVELVDIGLDGATPEKVRLRAGGRPLLRLDRGGRGAAVGAVTAAARAAIGWASAILVADYGRGMAAEPELRAAIAERAAAAVPVAWDPHPRGPAPVPGVALATPNEAEAAGFAGEIAGADVAATAARARALRERWAARAVCVTRGRHGALLQTGADAPFVAPAPPAEGGDPCGAGDRFAACAAAHLADGADPADAVLAAVAAASAFVAAGGAASVRLPASVAPRAAAPAPRSPAGRVGTGSPVRPGGAARPPAAGGADPAGSQDAGADGPARAAIAAVRAAGGVVVATGGCFDLLHPGHVETLEAARRLGDCLVVCLNSDASVRRLKGPSRPLVAQADRAAVLAALACVDAVVVFDEDTPAQVLERLRPDVWCKGGDYAGLPLPEADVLARWGGQAVVLPHRAGRSTTRLIEEAVHRAAR